MSQNIGAPYGYSDAPARPDYSPGYDPNTQSLTPELMQQLLNMQGFNKFKGEAMRTGPSAWANIANQQQNYLQQNALNAAGQSAAGQGAEARTQLAMRGGLSSGARERVARGGMRGFMDMSQDARRQTGENKLQIGINDEQNRMQQLGMLPGMEMDRTKLQGQAKQWDIQNALNEAQNKNKWAMDVYHEQGSMYGAKKQADATANSGGSCWLISGLARFVKLPADEPKLLTNFKAYMLEHELENSRFYIRRCGPLVTKMDTAGFDWVGFRWFNDSLVNLLRAGEYAAAYSLFRATLTDLLMTYWPECPQKAFTALVNFRKDQIAKAEKAFMPALDGADNALTATCLQNLPEASFA